jgi:hypothetical protein
MIVQQIEEEFWKRERKFSVETFRKFVRRFQFAHRNEVFHDSTFVASPHFGILLSRKQRLSYRKAAVIPLRGSQDQRAGDVDIAAVQFAVN